MLLACHRNQLLKTQKLIFCCTLIFLPLTLKCVTPGFANVSEIDEYGNWCHQRLVEGGSTKIQGTAVRFHSNPVSGKEPCKQSPTSTVTPQKETGETCLKQYLP